MPTALIVEDEPEANRLLAMLVQLRGYETESAFTGGEALELVRRRRPDIVFLDLMLPDTNGYEVCEALKSNRSTNPIPVVMVTARIASENRAHSFRVGATEYVPKPYTPDQIFDAMEAAESWRQDIATHEAQGRITIDSRDSDGPFAQIGLLQCLLMARTPWDERAVWELIDDLNSLALNVLDWAARSRAGEVARVAYQIQPDRLSLTIEDLAGWSGSDDLPHEHGLGLLLRQGRFDAVEYRDSGTEVTVVKRFDRQASPQPQ